MNPVARHLFGAAMLPACVAVQSASPAPAAQAQPRAIVCSTEASPVELLAAREIRRYVFLCTGKLLPVEKSSGTDLPRGDLLLIGSKARPAITANAGSVVGALAALSPQEYLLRTVPTPRRVIALLAGGDDTGTLYAAYRFAEHLGVRFYLHGDVVPDARAPLEVPALDETGRPLFAVRGIQPFHDFPEGPDWWNRDDYLAIVSQLPKLRMNFLGLHTYPEGGPNAEPTVWIGPPSEIGEAGRVKASYSASYQNTLRGNWGYAPRKTGDFACGSAMLFERDDFGAEVMSGATPNPQTPVECNEVFDRTATLLRQAFVQAHRLGVKTCVGTETPLSVPGLLNERLKADGRSSTNPAVMQELYEGIFRRAAQAYPLDYYWFWTPEDWTWKGAKPEQIAATTNDLAAAITAWERVKPPFALATCGWVLGPQENRALFDQLLPKDITLSCINRDVGRTPVEPGFAYVEGRSKWAIPWLEDDPALTAPQLWAGRMRRDASDARRYGCDGLLGIHWRTRILGPAVSALAHAAWTQAQWNTLWQPNPASATNFPPVADFYADWAQHEFGAAVASEAAAIFTGLDGRLPRPSDWVNGPGGIRPDPRPWADVSRQYAFVDELAALAPTVRGAGNLDRFNWWLHTFRYLRSMAQVNCTWSRLTNAIALVKAESNAADRVHLARDQALPLRRELIQQVERVFADLLASVSNPGELGTIANWNQHLLPDLLDKPGEELAGLLGEALPAEARLPKRYQGPVRLIVPTVRTSFARNEPLSIRVLVLADQPLRELTLRWRAMGRGRFATVPAHHLARGVYRAEFPAAATTGDDLEYFLEGVSPERERTVWPATAPATGQTLVAMEPERPEKFPIGRASIR